jgi:transposase
MRLQVESLRLATQPVDMRIGVDGLSLLVQQVLGWAPCDGTAYVFSNRRRTRLKLVCWDGNGVWLCLRRLHRGQFVWPRADDAGWQMSNEQWQWLIAPPRRSIMRSNGSQPWFAISTAAPTPSTTMQSRTPFAP